MAIAEQWNRLRASPMVGSYVVYALDFGLRIVVQLGYFLVISRSLGAAGYGLFASIVAISQLAAAFTGVGCEMVLIRRVARDKTPFPLALGNAISATVLSLPVLIPLATFGALTIGIEGLTLTAVLLIVASDVGLNRGVTLANMAFQAHERARPQFVINITTSLIKLGAALLAFQLTETLTLEAWAWWYAGSTALAGLFAFSVMVAKLGRPRPAFYPRDLGDGFIYALEFASMAALRDLDKPIVADTLGASTAGSYAAAFRIVDTACVPVRALLRTTYVRYFHHAGQGASAAIAFARRVLPIMAGISLVLALGLLVCAPIIPWLIGEDYAPSVPIIRWMAVYPLVFGLSAMGADLLRGLNLQRARLYVMLFTTVTYVPIVWAGAKIFGAEGAAIARTLSQAMLLFATVWIIGRVARRTGADPAASSARQD